MPIFDCNRCGMPLQEPDDSAGGQVSCPLCGHVCTVPYELSSPGTEIVPDPTAPGRSVLVRPGDVSLSGTDINSGTEVVPKAEAVLVYSLDDPEELPEELPEDLPKELPEELPPEPVVGFGPSFDFQFSTEDRDEEGVTPWRFRERPARESLGLWLRFAQGCQVVQYGILVELIGVALLFVILEVLVLDATGVARAPVDVRSPHAVLLPLLLPLAAGTMVIGTGRLLMLRVPAQTGAAAVLTAAAGLSWLRFVLLALATVFSFLAAFEESRPARQPHFVQALRLYALAVIAGWVAEVSVVPGLAVVGGEMPSRALRQRAAVVTFVIQLMAGLWLAMVVSGAYLGAVRGLVPEPISGAEVRPAARSPHDLEPEHWALVLTVVLGTLFAFQAGYAYLHYSLYAAGRSAGRTDGDGDL